MWGYQTAHGGVRFAQLHGAVENRTFSIRTRFIAEPRSLHFGTFCIGFGRVLEGLYSPWHVRYELIPLQDGCSCAIGDLSVLRSYCRRSCNLMYLNSPCCYRNTKELNCSSVVVVGLIYFPETRNQHKCRELAHASGQRRRTCEEAIRGDLNVDRLRQDPQISTCILCFSFQEVESRRGGERRGGNPRPTAWERRLSTGGKVLSSVHTLLGLLLPGLKEETIMNGEAQRARGSLPDFFSRPFAMHCGVGRVESTVEAGVDTLCSTS